MTDHGLSLRQACEAVDLHPSSYYYRPVAKEGDPPVREKLDAFARLHQRWGFWKIFGSLRNDGHEWNHKRVHRIYVDMGLKMRQKPKKRIPSREKEPIVQPLYPNLSWSMDFMHDGLINGKLSEFHAAMGHAVLDNFQAVAQHRKEQWLLYDEFLKPEAIGRIKVPEGVDYNYSYFPLLLDDEAQCMRALRKLQAEGIGARRYFYPLLCDLDYTSAQAELPVARSIASRVLCLPLYHDLTRADQEGIVEKVKESLKVAEKET